MHVFASLPQCCHVVDHILSFYHHCAISVDKCVWCVCACVHVCVLCVVVVLIKLAMVLIKLVIHVLSGLTPYVCIECVCCVLFLCSDGVN